jgi:hypothetical protein
MDFDAIWEDQSALPILYLSKHVPITHSTKFQPRVACVGHAAMSLLARCRNFVDSPPSVPSCTIEPVRMPKFGQWAFSHRSPPDCVPSRIMIPYILPMLPFVVQSDCDAKSCNSVMTRPADTPAWAHP